MATENILASATGAGTSDAIQIIDRPMTFSLWGTTLAAEYAICSKLASDGTTWEPAFEKPFGGTSEAVRMDADRTTVTIYGGGTYRFAMAARTGAQGIDVDPAPGR